MPPCVVAPKAAFIPSVSILPNVMGGAAQSGVRAAQEIDTASLAQEHLLRLLAECRSRFASPFRFRAVCRPSGELKDKRLFSCSSVGSGTFGVAWLDRQSEPAKVSVAGAART
jgi:hypothetical protein